jgi:hypothetical protein
MMKKNVFLASPWQNLAQRSNNGIIVFIGKKHNR